MMKYEGLLFQIIRFGENDVVTASFGDDNVAGANEHWKGWGDTPQAWDD